MANPELLGPMLQVNAVARKLPMGAGVWSLGMVAHLPWNGDRQWDIRNMSAGVRGWGGGRVRVQASDRE